MRKILCLLMCSLLLSGILAGCFDSREIDDLAYVMAVGMDKGKTNMLRLTLQFAVPTSLGGGGGGDGDGEGDSGGSKGIDTVTIDAPTIYSGLDMANSFISKQINLSHAKVLVFSQELARSGDMQKYVNAIARGREFRPNMYVVVSRDSAENYLRSVKPTLELNPAKYYDLIYDAYKYTGFTANTILHNFYTNQSALGIQPVATLAGVSKNVSPNDFSIESSTFQMKEKPFPLEGDYKAGDIPKAGISEAEIMGLAVFDGIKMIGEIDGEETLYYLMCTGQHNHAYYSLPEPTGGGNMLTVLDIRQARKPKRSVLMVEGKPVIDIELKLEADILSIQSGSDYTSSENIKAFEKHVSEYIKKGILNFLKKTAQELETDICGFGEGERRKFLTWDDWENFNWLDRYKDSTFNVEVKLRVRRPGLVIRSIPPVFTSGKRR